jgi:hypothetical protein
MKLEDLAYKNGKGKMVRGAAAFSHEVFTKCGGPDGFLKKYGTRIITLPIPILKKLLIHK